MGSEMCIRDRDLVKLVFGTYKPELVLAKLDVLLVTLLEAIPQYTISCRWGSAPNLLDVRSTPLIVLVGVAMVTTFFAKSLHQPFPRTKDLPAALALMWRSWELLQPRENGFHVVTEQGTGTGSSKGGGTTAAALPLAMV